MRTRALTLVAIAAAALVSAWHLGLDLGGLVPRGAGRAIGAEMASAMVRPAHDYEASVPPGTEPFFVGLALALWRTVLFAVAAMALALPAGLLLAVLASDAFWSRARAAGPERVAPLARAVQVAVRVFIALLRSVHELLWAVVFLAAIGLNSAAAAIAIALPFAGTIAKVGSEMFDEAPREPWRALRLAGAGPMTALCVGLVPVALGDVIGYAFYRLECALRSAAVLGFFGVPTIGLKIAQSFENLQFREMWMYVYALIALVVLFERWSAAARKRVTT